MCVKGDDHLMIVLQLIYSTFPGPIFNKLYAVLKICFLNNFFLAESIKKGNAQNMTGLYWMIGLIGSCIIVTLSYVSWRKYRGERKKSRNKYKSKQ